MTIFKNLREDHDYQRSLLDTLLNTAGDNKTRQETFRRLKDNMEYHAISEERYLYNPMIEHDKTQKHARHSIAEHHVMDKMIAELSKTDMDSSSWLIQFKKLDHQLRHHLEEEEKEIFPVAGKVLSEKEKETLGREYKSEMKKRE